MDKVNILVCDDDKEIVDAIEIYLQQEGYHVIKAYDGEQAIEQLEKNDAAVDPGRDDAKAGRNPCNLKDPGKEQHSDHHSFCKDRGCR